MDIPSCVTSRPQAYEVSSCRGFAVATVESGKLVWQAGRLKGLL
jgi:hypothetical protein